MQELVFVDESGINVNMARKYGYSPRGQRLYGYKPGQFARNYTVIIGEILSRRTVASGVDMGTRSR